MTHRTPLRPAPADFHEYYARYVDGVPDGDVVEHLRAEREELLALVESVPADRRGYRYADGKWTIEEVLGHVVDTERAFAYRIMCFVRGMADVEQPGIDQDVMVPASGATERGLDSIAREFDALRRSNLELFETLDDNALSIRGRASGTGFTVRSVLYIVHGHAAHHADVVRERYLAS